MTHDNQRNSDCHLCCGKCVVISDDFRRPLALAKDTDPYFVDNGTRNWSLVSDAMQSDSTKECEIECDFAGFASVLQLPGGNNPTITFGYTTAFDVEANADGEQVTINVGHVFFTFVFGISSQILASTWETIEFIGNTNVLHEQFDHVLNTGTTYRVEVRAQHIGYFRGVFELSIDGAIILTFIAPAIPFVDVAFVRLYNYNVPRTLLTYSGTNAIKETRGHSAIAAVNSQIRFDNFCINRLKDDPGETRVGYFHCDTVKDIPPVWARPAINRYDTPPDIDIVMTGAAASVFNRTYSLQWSSDGWAETFSPGLTFSPNMFETVTLTRIELRIFGGWHEVRMFFDYVKTSLPAVDIEAETWWRADRDDAAPATLSHSSANLIVHGLESQSSTEIEYADLFGTSTSMSIDAS